MNGRKINLVMDYTPSRLHLHPRCQEITSLIIYLFILLVNRAIFPRIIICSIKVSVTTTHSNGPIKIYFEAEIEAYREGRQFETRGLKVDIKGQVRLALFVRYLGRLIDLILIFEKLRFAM